MTTSQNKAIETLKNEFFKYYCNHRPDQYELKEVYTEEWEDTETVYIRLEIGMINDEGTMAELFCRNRTSVCIGKRGGYFSYRESTHKRCSLSLLDAITWGATRERIRKKMNNK